MLPTHLLATVVLGLVAARLWDGWDGRAWVLAIAFGVAIDIDHFARVPAYLAEAVPREGLGALSPWALKAYGGGWTSFFHEPIGAAIVFAVALALASPVPVLAWSLHRGMDSLVGSGLVDFAGPGEWTLLAVLALLAAHLGAAHVRARWAGIGPVAWTRLAARAFVASPVDPER